MRFININGEKANVLIAAQFAYKGFIVSASTIMSVHYAEVAVINPVGDFVDIDFLSVQDAIKWIDSTHR